MCPKHFRLRLRALSLIAVLATGFGGTHRDAEAAPIVGSAATVVREVRGQLEAVNRVLVVDSELTQDEEVSTGPGSATRILLKDGTNLELGENSRLKLTKLVFDADPSKSKVAIKALTGVFRWTSGSLPPSNYSISTPVATIGIRGTTLEFIVAEDGLTTVALTRGEVVVANTHGESVTLHPGEATTVLPPDPDGSQAAPSLPGGLPPNVRDQIMKMTRTVRVNEVQGITPGSGDASGGGGGVSAGLPAGTSPTSGPGTTPVGPQANAGAPATQPSDSPAPPAPPTFAPIVSPTGQPLAPISPATPVVVPAGPTAPIVTPTPNTKDMGTIRWDGVYDGTKKSFDLKLQLPGGGSVTLVSITQSGALDQFSITGARLNAPLTGDASGNALLGYLNFEPLPGDVGFFSGDVTFADAEGDSWIWHYAGTAI
ncbi:MAG: exported protein of unknown function, partial [Rhodospirillales bacterium]|nr:exported protein of unknown function [Rhodospirillales bacterium]